MEVVETVETVDAVEPVESMDIGESLDQCVERLAEIFYGSPWDLAAEDAKEYQRALIRTVLTGGHG